jgi:proteic killer suppression protein
LRQRIQQLQAAPDERVLRALKSLHFERLKGNRDHQHSIRLNDQWRLVLEFDDSTAPRTVIVKGIEDYH